MNPYLQILVHLVWGLLCYWLGWRTGRKLLLKATVDYVLSRPVPLRNYEERMLDYAKLRDSAPRNGRIIL